MKKHATATAADNILIVLAWTDTDGIRATGRQVQRDRNWFPEFESCLRGRAVCWLNAGTAADVEAARAYAARCGNDNAQVFTYPRGYQGCAGTGEA